MFALTEPNTTSFSSTMLRLTPPRSRLMACPPDDTPVRQTIPEGAFLVITYAIPPGGTVIPPAEATRPVPTPSQHRSQRRHRLSSSLWTPCSMVVLTAEARSSASALAIAESTSLAWRTRYIGKRVSARGDGRYGQYISSVGDFLQQLVSAAESVDGHCCRGRSWNLLVSSVLVRTEDSF